MATTNTVTLHKVIKTSPEKIFRAFTEPHALNFWLPPYGYLGVVDHLDVKVGGIWKMSFINFSTGHAHSFGGKYLEIEKNKFLKYTDKIDDPKLPEEMVTTVWLSKVTGGTDVKITQDNIPKIIPVEMCYLGWQDSIDKLTRLVEPEIPDM